MQLTKLLVLTTILLSCNSKKEFNNEKDFLTYLENDANGYTQSKTVKGVHFTLTYKPTDLLVQNELFNNNANTKIDSLRKKYKDYMYFNLSISKQNKELLSVIPSNINEFKVLARKLSFDVGEHINLYTKQKDTLQLLDYIYPRMYNLSHKTTLLLVYPKSEKIKTTSYLNFTVGDIGIQTGEIKFKIDTKKIINEPQIIF